MNKTFNSTMLAVMMLVPCIYSAENNADVSQTEPDAVMIDDFERAGASVKNCLGGEGGTWTLDPFDNSAYAHSDIVKAPSGTENSTKCLKITYCVDSDKPAINGYWMKLKNIDGSKYDNLEFDVMGGAKEGYSDTFRVEIKKFTDAQRQSKLTGMQIVRNVTDKWQKISIPLAAFNGLYDKTNPEVWKNPSVSLRNLDEVVIVFHKRGVSSKKGVLYFDNVRFVKTGNKTPNVFDRPPMIEKDKAYILLENPAYTKIFLIPQKKGKPKYQRVLSDYKDPEKIRQYLIKNPDYGFILTDGKVEYKLHVNEEGRFGFIDHDNYMKFLVNRLGGFPKKTVVHKKFPADDKGFLSEIARDTWAFFDNIVDKEHGLPLDTVILGKDKPLGEGGVISDYTNVTNIGIYYCSVVAGYDFGFISKDEAVRRLSVSLNTLKNLEFSKWGFVYNYYDTTWAKRTDYFISLVDSGWLAAGLYIVKNAFPQELGAQCSEILGRGSFSFFYDPVEQQMWHGFYENMNDYVNYHYGIFYAEPRLTSFIAIARGEVEEDHWFKMVRTFPSDYSWTTQKPKERNEKSYKDIKYYGGWYEYKNYKFVPSWGGSMFEALMPTLLLDEKKYAPEGLGANDETYVQASIHYTLNELRYPVWGMSPSSNPEGGYLEYGVKPLGASGYGNGAVTPHATFLALEFAPKEAILNLRKMIHGWDVYGEYGFYDALEPKSKKVAYKYLSLDQGMILIALDNYLNDGAIRKRFESDPIFEKAKHLLSAEKFFLKK